MRKWVNLQFFLVLTKEGHSENKANLNLLDSDFVNLAQSQLGRGLNLAIWFTTVYYDVTLSYLSMLDSHAHSPPPYCPDDKLFHY